MATPRCHLVDEVVTPWYHCVSRCVRKAFLCVEGHSHRKDWIEARLRELVDLFALDCAGFAIMDNHLHLLLRLDSQRAQNWSNEFEPSGRRPGTDFRKLGAHFVARANRALPAQRHPRDDL